MGWGVWSFGAASPEVLGRSPPWGVVHLGPGDSALTRIWGRGRAPFCLAQPGGGREVCAGPGTRGRTRVLGSYRCPSLGSISAEGALGVKRTEAAGRLAWGPTPVKTSVEPLVARGAGGSGALPLRHSLPQHRASRASRGTDSIRGPGGGSGVEAWLPAGWRCYSGHHAAAPSGRKGKERQRERQPEGTRAPGACGLFALDG